MSKLSMMLGLLCGLPVYSYSSVRINLAKSIQEHFCSGMMTCELNRISPTVKTICLQNNFEQFDQKLISCNYENKTDEEKQGLLDEVLKQREQQCLLLEHRSDQTFVVQAMGPTQKKLSLFIEDCTPSTSRQLRCLTKAIVVDNKARTIQLSLNDKILIQEFSSPSSCQQQWPDTRDSVNQYNLDPFSLPTFKTAYITQCYDGPYSHQGKYALDFRSRDGQDVLAVKSGVVVSVHDGSEFHCVSEQRKQGLYFKIYLNRTQHVGYDLRPCTTNDCGGHAFPNACRQGVGVNQVYVQHEDQTVSQYMHLKGVNNSVKFGDVVKVGEVVGQTGFSGWITATHLHFVANRMESNASGSILFQSIPITFKTNKGDYHPCVGDAAGIGLTSL